VQYVTFCTLVAPDQAPFCRTPDKSQWFSVFQVPEKKVELNFKKEIDACGGTERQKYIHGRFEPCII
jgi:hypothetical protein